MEREIYKYNDGTRDVYADPAELDYRILKAFERDDIGSIERNLSLPTDDDGNLRQDEVDNGKLMLFMDACHRLDPMVREAFQLAPFNPADGSGLTQQEVIVIYMDYINWKGTLKKSTG